MDKKPTHSTSAYKRTSTTAIVVNVGIVILLCSLFLIYVEPANRALLYGLVTYFVLSTILKLCLLSHQRTGMKLVQMKHFAPAQKEFEQSYQFFVRYPEFDKYRSVFMLDISAVSYTEMSLNNIAFCQCRLGDYNGARSSYEKLAKLSPQGELAKMGFEYLAELERNQTADSETLS
ncbi:MAG: hypothetical protein RR461_04280 [Angelakisella sp.]